MIQHWTLLAFTSYTVILCPNLELLAPVVCLQNLKSFSNVKMSTYVSMSANAIYDSKSIAGYKIFYFSWLLGHRWWLIRRRVSDFLWPNFCFDNNLQINVFYCENLYQARCLSFLYSEQDQSWWHQPKYWQTTNCKEVIKTWIIGQHFHKILNIFTILSYTPKYPIHNSLV